MDSPDGELTYNGVVYNEMKGRFLKCRRDSWPSGEGCTLS